jgi:hypothetical protein
MFGFGESISVIEPHRADLAGTIMMERTAERSPELFGGKMPVDL